MLGDRILTTHGGIAQMVRAVACRAKGLRVRVSLLPLFNCRFEIADLRFKKSAICNLKSKILPSPVGELVLSRLPLKQKIASSNLVGTIKDWVPKWLKGEVCKTSMREFKSHLSLLSLQRNLMVKSPAHNRAYASSSLAAATKCRDGVTATSRSPKPLFWVQILVSAFYCVS